ncbi:MAG: SDR family oxidoreductase [Ilumatobacteraceae bacterium]
MRIGDMLAHPPRRAQGNDGARTGVALGCTAWVCSRGRTSSSPACSPTRRRARCGSARTRRGREPDAHGAGRALSLTERTARKGYHGAGPRADVTRPEHLTSACEAAGEHFGGRVDAVRTRSGSHLEVCLGDDFMAATWDDVQVAINISAYSYKALADAPVPLMGAAGLRRARLRQHGQKWPAYNWMGVAKSALESINRYLARSSARRAIRCNLVAAGPVKTMAAKSIPGFQQFEDVWDDRAPLGWDVTDSSAVAKACVALMSDWFPATTGSMIHVDGGYHATGA